MAFRLPPLNTLRHFEAVARHLSFRAAAEELKVTASAVSHGIKILEDWLGTPLFARGRRGVSLTEAGAHYCSSVRDALSLIAAASDHVPGRRPRAHVRISVTPTFGSRLLLPRLGRFREDHTEITLFIDTTPRQVEFPRDGVDLAIRMGDGAWQGLVAEHLLGEELVPLCTPALKERLPDTADLCRLPLIHVTTVTEDWQAWSDATGAGPVDCGRGLKVDTIQMALNAATLGLGIVLGRRPLAEPELGNGTLVPYSDRAVSSRGGYWLVGLPETMKRPDIQVFRKWLLDELRTLSEGGGGYRTLQSSSPAPVCMA